MDKRNDVTPEKISQTLFAHMSTSVLITSVDLEVYTHIKNGHITAAEIAKTAQASPRGMETLLNGLVALNFLTKPNNTYQLTPVAEKFLVKGDPAYMGDWVLTEYVNQRDMLHFTEVVRTGKPYKKLEDERGEEEFKELDPGLFNVTYPMGKAAAEALGIGKTWKNLNVLDVGAGSGAWSIACAELDGGTKVTAMDLPGVLEITREFVDRFSLNERFTYLPGDMRKIDFGREKYDLVILGQICHMLGAETNRKLFSRIYRSLKRGGKLLISSFIPDDERSSAVVPLLFAAVMLVDFTEGNTYTMKEYRDWLQGAGFSSIATIDIPSPVSLIIANK